MKKNHKSILGLNTVKAFIVVLLALSIIAVVSLIIIGALANSVTTPLRTVTFVNTTTTQIMNNTQAYVISTSANCLATVAIVTNNTTPYAYCTTTNYSVSGCTITATYPTGLCNNSKWYVSGYFTDTEPAQWIATNTSGGIISFFGNATTYFALLGVVVIILIISLVVVVVNRFGGETGGGTAQNPSL